MLDNVEVIIGVLVVILVIQHLRSMLYRKRTCGTIVNETGILKRVNLKVIQIALRPSIIDTRPQNKANFKWP